jgi:hypothetical protein
MAKGAWMSLAKRFVWDLNELTILVGMNFALLKLVGI